MHVVPRWSGDANFITVIGDSKVIPQLLRDTRELLADRVGDGNVEAGRRRERLLPDDPGGLRQTLQAGGPRRTAAGFTPDSITIVGTAGSVLAALTLFPTGQLLLGWLVVSFFVLADMLDGAMARERGYGTRFGAVLDATCDRIATARSSAGCCGGRRSACTAHRWWWPP